MFKTQIKDLPTELSKKIIVASGNKFSDPQEHGEGTLYISFESQVCISFFVDSRRNVSENR